LLSPGKHYLQVPKDRVENIEYRLRLLDAVRRHGLVAVEAVRRMCAEDILFYINVFGNQYNPDKLGQPGEIGPFITYDFQDEALKEILWCIEHRRDLSIQKSRFMGASWLCLWAMEWLWHWRPYMKMLCVSRDADSVDKSGEPDSLFWKLDFMHEYQPEWLMPRGWKKKKHRISFRFRNPENHSTITGTSSTGKAGVGGRATVMFVDEFSQIEEDYELFNRSSNTTSCRIFNGTHLGLDTCFYEINDPASVVGAYIKRLTMHWTQHPDWNQGMYRYDPEKSRIQALDPTYKYPPDFQFVTSGLPLGGPRPGIRSPRYDHEVMRKTSQRAVAMDIDIDPHGASSQFFDAPMIFDRIRRDARSPRFEGELIHTQEGKPVKLEKGAQLYGDRCHLKLWCPLDHSGMPPEDVYTMGCDPGWGTGSTPSCITILNARTGEKVGEYTSSSTTTDKLGPYFVALARQFKNIDGVPAYIGWESNGPGIRLGLSILELGFRRVYYRTDQERRRAKKVDKPGWFVSPRTKLLLLDDYHAALKSGSFCNRSEEALKECLKFIFAKKGVRHGGDEGEDPTAARENHGDHVIADAIAWMLAKELGYGDAPARKVEKMGPAIGSFEWRQKRVQEEERRPVLWGSR
jgi:hypothetical protein